MPTKGTSNTVLAIDANNLISRAIYASALGDLQAGGVFTGGVFGALVSLRSILTALELEGFRVGRIVACFDNGVPTSRLKLLPDYKAARKERRDMLSDEDREKAFGQIGRCFDLWPSLGILCLAYRQREADDVIGAVVRESGDAVILSSDRDLWQLVSDRASIFDLRDNKVINLSNFEESTDGVTPQQWLLYKALIGDSSDGIKGVKGCGPKRALEIIRRMEFDADDRDARGMLCHMCAVLRDERRNRKLLQFEQSLVESESYIATVLRAIDLTRSFGKATGLRARLAQCPPVDRKAFLRQCRELSFESILGDPDGILNPFRRAEACR